MEKFFILFSLLILFSTVMTIVSLNPVHSVFWLVIIFIQSSLLIISVGFDFIGIILVIIYVGAIAILFLFVIMMLDIFQLSGVSKIYHLIPILILICSSLIMESKFKLLSIESNLSFFWKLEYYSQLQMLGKIFYTDYAISLILISILLLVAMIAAILLTLNTSLITRKQLLINQHQRNNSWI
uniref:NADH-ubiquinone oxidoreductase chain 6 n=1 Tax=Cladonema pacificum TaxID=499903 RepID=A0A0S2IB18_9CNID|nr:NADH dehydrogenase subunit 6 [Cladonema pacificum]